MTEGISKETLASIDKGMAETTRIDRGSFAKYVEQEEIREGAERLLQELHDTPAQAIT